MKQILTVILTTLIALAFSNCFQQKKETTSKPAAEPVQQYIQEVDPVIQEEVVEEQKEITIPPPEYPPLPIPESLVEQVKNETVTLIDAKGREIEVKLLELKKDLDIYLARFIRTSNNQEYTLDLRKLSADSQKVVHAFFKYRDYLNEKDKILAEWNRKKEEMLDDASSDMSTSASQIFNTLSNIGK